MTDPAGYDPPAMSRDLAHAIRALDAVRDRLATIEAERVRHEADLDRARVAVAMAALREGSAVSDIGRWVFMPHGPATGFHQILTRARDRLAIEQAIGEGP